MRDAAYGWVYRTIASCCLLSALWGASSCTSDRDGAGAELAKLGEFCTEDNACASGSCIPGVDTSVCSGPCERDEDCAKGGLVCGTGPEGEQSCVPGCEAYRYVCVEGRSVSCDTIPEGEHCNRCGCPSGTRCKGPPYECRPPNGVGGPCESDSDCTTLDCSTFAGVCRVPIGAPCNDTNCDRCITHESGFSFCSRYCGAGYSCGDALCIPGGGIGELYCGLRCLQPGVCPGQCVPYKTDPPSQAAYCRCDDCDVSSPLRDLGQVCAGDSQCRSGDCHGVAEAGPACNDFGCNSDRGHCSQPCSTGAECPAGMGCGWIPCAEDAGNTCGFKCMNLCGAGGFCRTGTCRAAETPERNTIQACDEKRKDGQVCGQDYECQSAHCSGGTCAPAAGAGVGTTCLRPQDCASGNCTNGTCK